MSVSLSAGELGLTAADMGVEQSETPSSFQELAKANGTFYNSLLDINLSTDTKEAKQKQLSEATAALPKHARGLYKKGLQAFQDELQVNHALLEQHRGKEVGYLVSETLQAGRYKREIGDVLDHLKPELVRFIEPSSGLPIILMEEELYNYLAEFDITILGSSAICLANDDRETPSYIIVKAHGLDNDGGDSSYVGNAMFRHELHHFVWHFLERSNFVREVQESSPELVEAFRTFRHEFAAYLVGGNMLSYIFDPERLTNSRDIDINERAMDIKEFVDVCMKIAANRGIDAQSFLYPVMTSGSFAELKKNILKLTPVDEQISPDDAIGIFDLWSESSNSRDIVTQILKEKHVTISVDTMREVALRLPRFGIRELRAQISKLAEFNSTLGNESLETDDLLMQALKGKLPFPDNVIQDIIRMPDEVVALIPISLDLETIVRDLLLTRPFKGEGRRTAYARLINATPEIRVVFDKLREKSIARDRRRIEPDNYDYSMADDVGKRVIEEHIKEREEFLNSF
jgi:hypothetical protein